VQPDVASAATHEKKLGSEDVTVHYDAKQHQITVPRFVVS